METIHDTSLAVYFADHDDVIECGACDPATAIRPTGLNGRTPTAGPTSTRPTRSNPRPTTAAGRPGTSSCRPRSPAERRPMTSGPVVSRKCTRPAAGSTRSSR